jgi:hypothetical protein
MWDDDEEHGMDGERVPGSFTYSLSIRLALVLGLMPLQPDTYS